MVGELGLGELPSALGAPEPARSRCILGNVVWFMPPPPPTPPGQPPLVGLGLQLPGGAFTEKLPTLKKVLRPAKAQAWALRGCVPERPSCLAGLLFLVGLTCHR